MSIPRYNNTGKPNKGLSHISKPTRTNEKSSTIRAQAFG